jgi:phosphate-selective porin
MIDAKQFVIALQLVRLRTFALAGAFAVALAAMPVAADIVQGTVTPADAKVVVKNSSGEQVAELGGGAFQLRLPAGRFTAECTEPAKKTVNIFSLAQPTTVNIDCT